MNEKFLAVTEKIIRGVFAQPDFRIELFIASTPTDDLTHNRDGAMGPADDVHGPVPPPKLIAESGIDITGELSPQLLIF